MPAPLAQPRANPLTAGPICDTHLHIYDPAFPYDPGAALQPPLATCDDYRAVFGALGVRRSVVVQPTTYGYDNRCTLDAVKRLGRANARAVVVVPPTISDDALLALAEAGACGVRINALRGAPLDAESLSCLAWRIAPLGWHVQLHVDGATLMEQAPLLAALPTPVVLDHMGRMEGVLDRSNPAWHTLRGLLDQPHIWVKLSAPYLLQPDGTPDYPALSPLVDTLAQTAPQRLLWGSDWPHPGWRAQGQPDLDEAALAQWAWGHLERHGLAQAALVDNPARLYGFAPSNPG